MPRYRIRDAAALVGISDDTMRRWAETGRITTVTDDAGRMAVEGSALAALAVELAAGSERAALVPDVLESARNRLTGIVTRVVRDEVMAQVDLQAGPFRVVSLMSREAADELGLEPGVLATAVVKATTVIVEVPRS